MGGRSAPRIILSVLEREELERAATDPEVAPAIRRRSRTILACAEGKTNIEVGREVGLSNGTVGKLRAQFLSNRLRNFCAEKRGRPPKPLHLSPRELTTLHKLATLPKQHLTLLGQKANVILLCAAGMSTCAVAYVTGIPQQTVGKIRSCFQRGRLDGLKGDPKRTISLAQSSMRSSLTFTLAKAAKINEF